MGAMIKSGSTASEIADGDELLTFDAARKLLGIALATFEARIASGDIPCLRYKMAGSSRSARRVYKKDVLAYRDRCYVPARTS